MDYKIMGWRIAGEPQVFVIRPNGDCGWNPVQDKYVVLERYRDNEPEIKLEIPEQTQSQLARGDTAAKYLSGVFLSQSDLDRIAGSKHIDLSDAEMFDLDFQGDFFNANFQHAHIGNCRATDADFINCNFQEATLGMECRDSQFIHNNCTKAKIIDSSFKDTVLDANNFKQCTFKDVRFSRFSIIKDNSFLQSSFDRTFIGHIDVRGENKHLDTISYTMKGLTEEELAEEKQRFIQNLQPGAAERVGDMRLQDIDWVKVDAIYAYEAKQDLPPDRRITEWKEDYGMAVLKPDTAVSKFHERYEEAVYQVGWKEPAEKTMEEAAEEFVMEALAGEQPELPCMEI